MSLDENRARTVVIGLGNPILTDDGVGIRVAELVQSALPPGSGVDVKEVSLGGLGLMETIVGYDRVILIDALGQHSDHPGRVHRLALEDLTAQPRHSFSPHDIDLTTALGIAEQAGLGRPDEVVIYGIEIDNVTDFGERLTPAVAAAVPRVAEAVLAELGQVIVEAGLNRRGQIRSGLAPETHT